MKTWFWYRENPDGTFSIIPMYKELKEDWRIIGSWAALPARLFGLSWADYLKYCIQCGADVYGKGCLYPMIKWKKQNQSFLNELNKRANLLIQVK